MRIAVLGWGSLIWDPRDLPLVGGWNEGGPSLPIEFSRVSNDGRLTLVIDPDNGVDCPTRFAESARADLEDAVCDLRNREGTIAKYIGFVDLVGGSSRCAHAPVLGIIRDWARSRGFDAVVWTDLPANFEEETGAAFSAERALQYLRTLPREIAEQAKEYVKRAPAELDTPLRQLAPNLWRQLSDTRTSGPTDAAEMSTEAWQAIEDAIDACPTCRKDTCFIPRLPPLSRPWNPVRKGRLLLISEAPPESGGFWHVPRNDEPSEQDDLRAQLLRLLEPHGLVLRSGPREIAALRSFVSGGLFLVQTLKWPLRQLPGKKGRSFNHLRSEEKARLVEHVVAAHLRQEVSAIAPAGILAMGNAALAACRLLSENAASIPEGGVETVRKNNQQGLDLVFERREIPFDVTLLPVDQNMRIPDRERLIKQDLATFLSSVRWNPNGPPWPDGPV